MLTQRCLLTAAALLLAAAVTGTAFGQADYTWKGPTGTPSGVFGAAANWTPAGPPSPTDRAVFGLPATYTVTFDNDYVNDRLLVSTGNVTLDLGGHTYSLVREFTPPNTISVNITDSPGEFVTARLTVGNGNVVSRNVQLGTSIENIGELTITTGGRWSALSHAITTGADGAGTITVQNGGIIEYGDGVAAAFSTGTGAISVTGPGSMWRVTGDYLLGERGTATLTIQGGGWGSVGRLVLGKLNEDAGSEGTAIIDGVGSRLELTNPNNTGLIVGDEGRGTLIARNGAKVTADWSVILGMNASGNGNMTISGAGTSATTGEFVVVGHGGTASLTVEAGGSLNSGGDVILGYGSTGRGSVTVTGAGSVIRPTHDGYTAVGAGGEGTLTVANGGRVTSSSSYIAHLPGGRGDVLVDGRGSIWDIWHFLNVAGYNGDGGGTGSLTVRGGGRVTVANEGEVNIYAGGTVRVEDGTLTATGEISNGGKIQMASDQALVQGSMLMNYNLISGRGTIASSLLNNWNGEIRVAAGDQLAFTGDVNTNAGKVSITGGTLEFAHTLANSAGGLITGRGTLIFDDGFGNVGTLAFSGGMSDVFGNVGNGAGGICAVTGNGVATFYNNFVNDGEVRVYAGSTAVFMGTLSGSHGTTGGGTVIIEGDLSGGHSPAAVAFEGNLEFGPGADLVIELAGLAPGAQYDQVIVGGNLVADGTLSVRLLDGFSPGVGTEFDVLEFAAIDGTFDAVNLPGLAPGLRWDASSLYSDGILTVVPEPATLSLLALGGMGALLRRRRK